MNEAPQLTYPRLVELGRTVDLSSSPGTKPLALRLAKGHAQTVGAPFGLMQASALARKVASRSVCRWGRWVLRISLGLREPVGYGFGALGVRTGRAAYLVL